MSFRTTTILGILAGFALPVHAQQTITEGPGHEVTEGTVLHPTVALESGFISNVFYEDTSPASSGIARIIAGLSIASQGNKQAGHEGPVGAEPSAKSGAAPLLDFRFGAELRYEQYISSNDFARDASDFGAAADLEAIIFPQGSVSFVIKDRFDRDTRPRNFESSGTLNRDVNRLRLGINLKPGHGTLTFGLWYENLLDRFESSDSSFADRFQHDLGATISWQYLPYTRFFLEGSFGFYERLGSDDSFKSTSNPLRVRAGVATLLTPSTSLRLHAGYGRGFYDVGEDFGSVIGGIEFGYRYSSLGKVSIAYERDFKDSINANLFADHAVSLKLDQKLGAIMLAATIGARLREYRGIPASIGESTRDDTIFHADISGKYPVRDWLGLYAIFRTMIDEQIMLLLQGMIPAIVALKRSWVDRQPSRE